VNEPVKCLHALAHSLFTFTTYPTGHVARRRALESWYAAIQDLLETDPRPVFSLLEQDVVYGQIPLREMRGWKWSNLLASVGVQRIEFDRDLGVTVEELEEFVDDLLKRLEGRLLDSSEARQTRASGIMYGQIAIDGEDIEDGGIATAGVAFTLGDEAGAIRWLHAEISQGRGLPLAEAEAVVRTLSLAMHGEQHMLLPLLKLRQFDEYTTTHSLNVSVLAMALAEWFGLGARDVRAFGVAGLMHDLGKVKIPKEILNKPGKFDDREREIMKAHPAEGAKIILASDEHLDLAAVVAYEHHIMINGGGYPNFTFPRDCHRASKLVHVCDVYDALRTKRPYRNAWPAKKVLAYLEERSGREFDGEIAHAFSEMMRTWEPQIAYVEEDEELPGDVPSIPTT
jgi:putative nucleotidyltransferase with HDIG domain